MRNQPTAPATGLASILPDRPAGSLALAAAVAASARDEARPVEDDGPASIDDSNGPATFDWFAAQTFGPAATPADLDDLRAVYDDSFQPLALAVALLSKNSDEMAETAGAMLDGDPAGLIESTLGSMAATREWLAESGEVIRSAETRLVAGMCRAYKAKGGRIMDYALPATVRNVPQPDAILIALGAEMDRREAALVAMRAVVFLDVEEKDAQAWAAYRAADDAQEAFIGDRIAPLRATTQAGTAVKARALAYLGHPESWARSDLAGTVAGAVIFSLADDLTPAVSPAPHSDAALIEIGERWRQTQRDWLQHDQMGGPTPTREHDAAGDAIFARDTAAVRDAAAMPAAGILGLAVKARMFAREADHLMDNDRLFPTDDDSVIEAWAAAMKAHKDWTRSIIGSLIVDILRLAGEASR